MPELLEDIEEVLARANERNLAAGTHIYSIQVLEPLRVENYLYCDVIYSMTPGARKERLSTFLANTRKVEVALRRDQDSALERKTVKLNSGRK